MFSKVTEVFQMFFTRRIDQRKGSSKQTRSDELRRNYGNQETEVIRKVKNLPDGEIKEQELQLIDVEDYDVDEAEIDEL